MTRAQKCRDHRVCRPLQQTGLGLCACGPALDGTQRQPNSREPCPWELTILMKMKSKLAGLQNQLYKHCERLGSQPWGQRDGRGRANSDHALGSLHWLSLGLCATDDLILTSWVRKQAQGSYVTNPRRQSQGSRPWEGSRERGGSDGDTRSASEGSSRS